MQRFHDCKMDSSENVVQFISKVQNMSLQLSDLGQKLPDLVVMSKILTSLLAKYRGLRTAWSSVAADKQTIELLLERLIEEEGLLRADEDKEAVALAAVTSRKGKGGNKGKGNNSSSDRRDKENVKCFKCHTKGHYAIECPEKKKEGQDSLHAENP